MSMLMSYYSVPILSSLCGLWVFCSKRKHLLNTLLSLEYIMLSVFWLMVLSLSLMGQEVFFSLFFLTFAACEGALGLALLVSIVRSHGNDRFGNFNLLQC
uniref:NADH dehydrogenase subunit 4L n=1 Tax=Euphausia crystallorophias TaxID=48141 RepID=UPI0028FC8C0F|nr:NADH dehydrogenase subunit 4L [Euphausia crystallorophias]WNI01997.1 NADH dehydrogenase subunit 4L [Euphausia crystallorophias]